jgi:hypothetical protein
MTTAEKGFLLAYSGASLSKTAGVNAVLTGPSWADAFVGPFEEENRRRQEDAMVARAGAGGVAGLVVGGGLSAVWGKLHDNPSAARDLVVGLATAAAGMGAGSYSGYRKGERSHRGLQFVRGGANAVQAAFESIQRDNAANLATPPARALRPPLIANKG